MKFDRRLTDEIYTSDTVRLGKDAFQAMQETIYHNGGVGTIAGYYDPAFVISCNRRHYLAVAVSSCIKHFHDSGRRMCAGRQRMARVAPVRVAPVLRTR